MISFSPENQKAKPTKAAHTSASKFVIFKSLQMKVTI